MERGTPTAARTGWIWGTALAAGLFALALNVTLRTLAVHVFDIAATFEPLGIVPVSFLTLAGVLAAAIVYRMLHAKADEPFQTFAWLAASVVLLSWLGPLALLTDTTLVPGTTTRAVMVLMFMHVTTAAVLVGAYWREATLPEHVPLRVKRSRANI